MNKPTQRRKLETRAKLLAATQAIISSSGYSAMRVEEVIQRAGVAKGTFFSHFQNKDSLMELIISAEIEKYLDEIEEPSTIQDVDDLVNRLLPLLQFMTSERYIFDLFLRHSGAAAAEKIGPIAQTLDRQVEVLVRCLPDDRFRKDVPKVLLAEGIQAFIVQAMALKLCAIQSHQPLPERLKIYLEAWLQPQAAP